MSEILGIDTDNYAVQSLKSTGGGSATLQSKSVTITDNTTTNVTPDTGYDGLSSVAVTTNVTPNLQSKSVTITENTTTTIQADSQYDGLGQVEVTTNVSGGGSIVLPDGTRFSSSTANNLDWLSSSSVDTSDITLGTQMFYRCSFTNAPLFNTSNIIDATQMFEGCGSLKTLPAYDFGKCNSFGNFAYNCTRLEDVPVFDLSKVTSGNGTYNMFYNCTALTNASLNNIMASLITTNITSYYNRMNLKSVGLSSAQATTCQSLSNYQAFTEAGWTTGY